MPHFIDKYVKSREFVPGPKYDTITNWKNNFKARGQFSKSPRITFTERIMKDNKLYESPGPGAYAHKEYLKREKQAKAGSVAKTEKVCAFIEEAQYVGLQTPAPKYDVNFVRSMSLTTLMLIGKS